MFEGDARLYGALGREGQLERDDEAIGLGGQDEAMVALRFRCVAAQDAATGEDLQLPQGMEPHGPAQFTRAFGHLHLSPGRRYRGAPSAGLFVAPRDCGNQPGPRYQSRVEIREVPPGCTLER